MLEVKDKKNRMKDIVFFLWDFVDMNHECKPQKEILPEKSNFAQRKLSAIFQNHIEIKKYWTLEKSRRLVCCYHSSSFVVVEQ